MDFFSSFSNKLNSFYIAQYNNPALSTKNTLISDNFILKIGTISEPTDMEHHFFTFYKVLRDFYLVNIASKEEFVIKNIDKTEAKRILDKKREELSGNYKDLFEFPDGKAKVMLLFNKDFYRELKLKKLGVL